MGRKGKETTFEERKIAFNAFCAGKSYKEIAELLNRPESTIKSIISRFGSEGFLANKPQSGQPKKLGSREERLILRKVRENPRISAPKLTGTLEAQLGTVVSVNTVRRTLYGAGFHGRIARRKPFISKKNKANRP